jgi:hypothetical protein
MSGRSSFLSHPWRVLRWAGLAAAVPAVWACTSRTLEAPVVTPTQAFTNTVTQKVNSNIDILFMIDNSSSMTSMQSKLLAQLPVFMQVLQALPMGLPSVHVGVVSSDMGAPSDSMIKCTNTGDDGKFWVSPEGTCTSAGFTDPNAAYITDDSAGMTKNFSAADPAGIATVFQCIGLLGSLGCGFEHQLASIDRALGSDGQGPSPHPDFIRSDAYLGIVMLTNEDDCSAPASNTPLQIFSLNEGGNSQQDNLETPGGPLANYRCNGKPWGGHKCQDLSAGSTDMTLQQPPFMVPADATGTPLSVTYSNCESEEDTSLTELTPVGQFVTDIKSLKGDPNNQILVAAVTGVNPSAADPTVYVPQPYNVNWTPGPAPDQAELFPNVTHVCGPTTDGSFADPAVRIAQFVNAFGTNGVLASICDNSYSSSMAAIAAKIGALITPKCIAGMIQQDANGNPNCTVINNITTGGTSVIHQIAVPACVDQPGFAPCWSFLAAGDPMNKCGGIGQALSVTPDPNNPMPDSLNSSIQCSTCITGVSAPGCPCTGAANDVTGCLCTATAMPAGCK